jgi:hypothetical protein
MAATAHADEHRLHKRIAPGRRARLAVGDAWVDCTILDISGGGASLAHDLERVDDRHVVLCDADLGMIAATVERAEPGRLVLTFGIDRAARERLIDRLMTLLNADQL